MRDLVSSHPLIGKTADFDWRSKKEEGTEYDSMNFSVVQGIVITEIRQDCYGEYWAYSEQCLPQNIRRICKVY